MGQARTVIRGAALLAAALGLAVALRAPLPFLASEPPQALLLEDVTLTSTANAPAPAEAEGPQAGAVAQDSAAATPPEPGCGVAVTAAPLIGAFVALDLVAPCLPEARFVLHHNGMMFSALTDAQGEAQLTVPALSRNAVYIIAFDTGEGAAVRQEIDDLSEVGHVVLQWRGDVALGLHAREAGAGYFTPGHVYREATGAMARVAEGRGGVLHRLGAGRPALMAEVYTFPVAATSEAGRAIVSAEIEITESNCATEIEATLLEAHPARGLRARDLLLYMPDCAAAGDYLVLKNMLEDMTLSAR